MSTIIANKADAGFLSVQLDYDLQTKLAVFLVQQQSSWKEHKMNSVHLKIERRKLTQNFQLIMFSLIVYLYLVWVKSYVEPLIQLIRSSLLILEPIYVSRFFTHWVPIVRPKGHIFSGEGNLQGLKLCSASDQKLFVTMFDLHRVNGLAARRRAFGLFCWI